MTKAQDILGKLKEQLRLQGNAEIQPKGCVLFSFQGINIRIKQRNVIGSILEEWLDEWLKQNFLNIEHNPAQSFPDFWLNPQDRESDLLEVKAFYKSPNFDVAAFLSYKNEIRDKPYRLNSNYLIFRYEMDSITGDVSIKDVWLKKIWEICCSSEKFPIKTQFKNGQITNIRPATWYSRRQNFPTFTCKEDFLSALEETIYSCNATRGEAQTWKSELCKNYKKTYGESLVIPRWDEIKQRYVKAKGNKSFPKNAGH